LTNCKYRFKVIINLIEQENLMAELSRGQRAIGVGVVVGVITDGVMLAGEQMIAHLPGMTDIDVSRPTYLAVAAAGSAVGMVEEWLRDGRRDSTPKEPTAGNYAWTLAKFLGSVGVGDILAQRYLGAEHIDPEVYVGTGLAAFILKTAVHPFAASIAR
jgi:hypothetical protein